jgi:hypothetical protein
MIVLIVLVFGSKELRHLWRRTQIPTPPPHFVNTGFSYLYSMLLPVGELVRNGDVCFVGDLTADTQAPVPSRYNLAN